MRLRAALLGRLAGTALAVPAGPAAATACTDSGAVTVVVDFASLGGGTQTRCTGNDPSSGLAALRATGYTPTRAAQQPGYFVCRINGKPASDPCQRTSPADAYWSYWHAQRGGSWTYSSLGPADYDPPPGTVEGWAFGAGKPPSSAPPPRTVAPASSPPASRPTAAAPATSPRPAADPAATAPAAAPTTSRRPASPAASASATSAPTATATASALGTGDPTASPTPATAPLADPPATTSAGTRTGPLLAGGLVALLVAAAGVTAVRRRRDPGA